MNTTESPKVNLLAWAAAERARIERERAERLAADKERAFEAMAIEYADSTDDDIEGKTYDLESEARQLEAFLSWRQERLAAR